MQSRTIVARHQGRKTRYKKTLLPLCKLYPTCQGGQSDRVQWQIHPQVPFINFTQARPLPPHWRPTRGKWPVCLPSLRRVHLWFSQATEITPWHAPYQTNRHKFWHCHQAFIQWCGLRAQESLERGISLPPLEQACWANLPSDLNHPYQFQIGK